MVGSVLSNDFELIEKMNCVKKIAVCIPTYNRKILLCEAIDSVLSSNYTDYDLYIFDNQSTDGTVEHIKNKYDKQINVFTQPTNIGMGGNSNYIIEKISSWQKYKYILMLHDDDKIKKDFLRKTSEIIESDKNIVYVGTACENIDEEGNVLYSTKYSHFDHSVILDWKEYFYHHVSGLSFPWSGTLIRIDKIQSNRFDYESHPYIADAIFLASLAVNNKVAYIPEYLFQYRIHKSSTTNILKVDLLRREWYENFAYYSNLFESYNLDSCVIKKHRAATTNAILNFEIENSRTILSLTVIIYNLVFHDKYFHLRYVKPMTFLKIIKKYRDVLYGRTVSFLYNRNTSLQ